MSGKGLLGFALVFVLLVSIGMAATSSCGDGVCSNDGVGLNLYEGKPQTVKVGGIEYNVEATYISGDTALIKVNNETSSALAASNSATISGLYVYVENILYSSDPNASFVKAILGENKVSCPKDCSNQCTDSDAGINYHVKGTVTWDGYSVTDTCLDSYTLIENYCKDNTAVNETYTCPNECKDGACIKVSSSCAGNQCTLYENSPTKTTIDGGEVLIEMVYISASSVIIKVNGIQSGALAEGTSGGIAGFNVYVNKIIYSPTASSYTIVTLSKATVTCPASIDIEFDKDSYYMGEIGTVIIKIYDSSGNPIPNQRFIVKGIIDDKPMGPITYYTDSSGIYKSSGSVGLPIGRYEYTVYTDEAGCDSVSDTDSVTFMTKCGDGYCAGAETSENCPTDCRGICREGETKSCGNDVGACNPGWMYCKDGTWGPCEGSIGPITEICGNGLDDDCDGIMDEECQCPAKIDLAFGKSVYYVGETGTLKVVVYDSRSNLMYNQQFKATGYVNGKLMVYETTLGTGPTGVYTSSGTVTDSLLGTVRYDVWINTSTCGHIYDSETITVKESPIKISISSVWSDKDYYTAGEGVKIFVKVIDNDGTPAEPGEGTQVSFSLYSPDKYYTSMVHTMEYNSASGYYEKIITAPGEGAWWVHATATKAGQSAANNQYYFKVVSQTKFIAAAFEKPINGETVSGTVFVKATAKSSAELTGMDLAIKSENTGVAFPLTNCVSSATKCAAGEKCEPPIYYMTCEYKWDTTGYQGKIGLTVTAKNRNGEAATHNIVVYATGGTGFISVNIESPRDGETVSGTQIVKATAKSSANLTGMTMAIESENTGVAFPLTNCAHGVGMPVCPSGEVCNPVYSMTCEYKWDTTYYSGKKVGLSVTARDVGNKGASHNIIVYVGIVAGGWTEEEVRQAFENMPIVRQYGLVISSKKGEELLNGISPVMETPARRIVEPWKKYWVLSSPISPPLYYIILEDASGPSPLEGEYLVYFNSKILGNTTLPSGIIPLERAKEILADELNLEKFDMGEAGLILLNFGGMVRETGAVDISQIVPAAAVTSAAGGGGMATGMMIAASEPIAAGGGGGAVAPSSGGSGGGVSFLAYWAIRGTGIKQDGSIIKLEILMDARTGQILVGPTPGIEDIIRKKLEPGFSQLGLKIAQLRQVSEEELKMAITEMREMCEKIESLDSGGIYWLISDADGVLRLFVRQGKVPQPVIITKTEPPTGLEIEQSITAVQKAAIITEVTPSITVPEKEAIPIGMVAAAAESATQEVAVPVTESEIMPVLFIYDVQKMSELPGLDESARTSINEVIEGTKGVIKGDLGAGDLKFHNLNMVMMYRASSCPPCPSGYACEPCIASYTKQFVYAKGLTSGEEPVKFAYTLDYPGYSVLCKKTSGIDKNQLEAHLWISKNVVIPGDSIIVRSKVTDYQGNPVPNAGVSLTMGPVKGFYTCPVCEVPPEIKTQIARERQSMGIGGGYACRPCVYEEEVIQTIVGETDSNGTWTYLLKIANVRSGEYKLELRVDKGGYASGYDKKMIIVNNIGPVENRTFQPIDLVRIVLRLETMKINILKLKPTAQAIANYYGSVGETEKANSWQGIVGTIETISSKIEDVKKLIKDLVANPSEEKLIAIKGEIIKIKKEIEDLLLEIIRVA